MELKPAERATLQAIWDSPDKVLPFNRLNRAARLTLIGGRIVRNRMEERHLIARQTDGFTITVAGMRALGVRP